MNSSIAKKILVLAYPLFTGILVHADTGPQLVKKCESLGGQMQQYNSTWLCYCPNQKKFIFPPNGETCIGPKRIMFDQNENEAVNDLLETKCFADALPGNQGISQKYLALLALAYKKSDPGIKGKD